MYGIPRITSVHATAPATLRVKFDSGQERVYDCTALLARPEFFLLRTPAFFRAVKVDPGGYGVSWNDDLDLSGIDLWNLGKPCQENARCHLGQEK
jgi:hypothetical protein